MRRRNVALILTAAALVGATLWLSLRTTPEDHMAAFVADLRARGEPVTLADMEVALPPADENGEYDLDRALVWLEGRLAQVDAELETRGIYDGWWGHYVGPWNAEPDESRYEQATPEELEELRGFLDTLGPFFDGFAAATSKREIVRPWPEDSMSVSTFGSAGPSDMDALRLVEALGMVAATPAERHRAIEWRLEYARRVRSRTRIDHAVAAFRRRLSCDAMRDGVEAGRLDPRRTPPARRRAAPRRQRRDDAARPARRTHVLDRCVPVPA